jgi:hypothetical protein
MAVMVPLMEALMDDQVTFRDDGSDLALDGLDDPGKRAGSVTGTARGDGFGRGGRRGSGGPGGRGGSDNGGRRGGGLLGADFFDNNVVNFSFDGNAEMVHGDGSVSGCGVR